MIGQPRMDEEFEFWVTQERLLPASSFTAEIPERMGSIIGALKATGSIVGTCRLSIQEFAAAFEQLGELLGVGDYLAQSAIASSPHDLLPDDDLKWRMGFFGEKTVELLQNAMADQHEEIVALGQAASDTANVHRLFLAACDEAHPSGQAIVIIHNRA